jgi:phospholipase D1/2
LKRVGLHKVAYLNKKKDHGTLEFFVEFIPVRMLGKTMEVPGTYFTQTNGNSVKLYMNADDDGSSPLVKFGNDGKVWEPPRLWRDIYDAICNAKTFVYMVGWSIDTDQYLLRGDELEEARATGKYNPQIGPLLKQKAEENVTVNLMQWDDYSSGVMFPGEFVILLISCCSFSMIQPTSNQPYANTTLFYFFLRNDEDI